MPIIKSRIEDSTHIYTIAAGSGREGLAVYLVASHANRVALGNASDILTSQIVGTIKKDYGTNVEIDNAGNILAVPETGIVFSFGENVFLSSLEAGKVTNISPSTVCVRLGNAVRMRPSLSKVEMTLQISEVIEL